MNIIRPPTALKNIASDLDAGAKEKRRYTQHETQDSPKACKYFNCAQNAHKYFSKSQKKILCRILKKRNQSSAISFSTASMPLKAASQILNPNPRVPYLKNTPTLHGLNAHSPITLPSPSGKSPITGSALALLTECIHTYKKNGCRNKKLAGQISKEAGQIIRRAKSCRSSANCGFPASNKNSPHMGFIYAKDSPCKVKIHQAAAKHLA